MATIHIRINKVIWRNYKKRGKNKHWCFKTYLPSGSLSFSWTDRDPIVVARPSQISCLPTQHENQQVFLAITAGKKYTVYLSPCV